MSLLPEVPRNGREGSSQCVRLVSTPTTILFSSSPFRYPEKVTRLSKDPSRGVKFYPHLLRTKCKKDSREPAYGRFRHARIAGRRVIVARQLRVTPKVLA